MKQNTQFLDQDLARTLETQAFAGEIRVGELAEDALKEAVQKYRDFLSQSEQTGSKTHTATGHLRSNKGNNRHADDQLAMASKLSTSFALTSPSYQHWPSFTSGFNSFSGDLGYMPGADTGQSAYGLEYDTGDVVLSQSEASILEADRLSVEQEAQEDSALILRNAQNNIVGPLSLENHYNATANMAGVIGDDALMDNVTNVQMERDGYVRLEDGSFAPTAGKLDSLSGQFEAAEQNLVEVQPSVPVTVVDYSNAGLFNQTAQGVAIDSPMPEPSIIPPSLDLNLD